jgi:hypothetical protein
VTHGLAVVLPYDPCADWWHTAAALTLWFLACAAVGWVWLRSE